MAWFASVPASHIPMLSMPEARGQKQLLVGRELLVKPPLSRVPGTLERKILLWFFGLSELSRGKLVAFLPSDNFRWNSSEDTFFPALIQPFFFLLFTFFRFFFLRLREFRRWSLPLGPTPPTYRATPRPLWRPSVWGGCRVGRFGHSEPSPCHPQSGIRH